MFSEHIIVDMKAAKIGSHHRRGWRGIDYGKVNGMDIHGSQWRGISRIMGDWFGKVEEGLSWIEASRYRYWILEIV